MVTVSLDSPSCKVTLLILYSVVYQDITRQAKGLYRLKHVGALRNGLTYLSRYNSGWFCHSLYPPLYIREARVTKILTNTSQGIVPEHIWSRFPLYRLALSPT
jgi:hypothetical protein